MSDELNIYIKHKNISNILRLITPKSTWINSCPSFVNFRNTTDSFFNRIKHGSFFRVHFLFPDKKLFEKNRKFKRLPNSVPLPSSVSEIIASSSNCFFSCDTLSIIFTLWSSANPIFLPLPGVTDFCGFRSATCSITSSKSAIAWSCDSIDLLDPASRLEAYFKVVKVIETRGRGFLGTGQKKNLGTDGYRENFHLCRHLIETF